MRGGGCSFGWEGLQSPHHRPREAVLDLLHQMVSVGSCISYLGPFTVGNQDCNIQKVIKLPANLASSTAKGNASNGVSS